jgi:23S rRNA (cytosine1962-C5)-methyltransferase
MKQRQTKAGPPASDAVAAWGKGAAPAASAQWERPWVQLKYFSYHPSIFKNMVGCVSDGVRAGDLVHVYDKNGNLFGTGFYNPRALIPVRVFRHGTTPAGEAWLDAAVLQAADLRRTVLKLDAVTDAYRVIHSDADGISGLMVDRYGETLAVEVTSLGACQRIERWLPLLHGALGTSRAVITVEPRIVKLETIFKLPPGANAPQAPVKIQEHGIRYEVDFRDGHKTGFFCDQRDNRLRFSRYTAGKSVLDLCCYSGGFALAARLLGDAGEVTGVDLDEKAIAQAKRNANLNRTRIHWVHADAFSYARQMQQNGTQWDVVMLDPPKLVMGRDEEDEGRRKYDDLNSLALGLVRPGGIFVTCSCSGLLDVAEFEQIVFKAAHRQGRKLQVLERTGAGADHPTISNCPETRYLKALWCRVLG